MKFTVERDVLADAVAWAARTLPSRPHNPVLSGLQIEAIANGPEAGRLVISSFDMEVASKVEIAAEVDEPGITLVHGRMLSDIAKSLPNMAVQISLDGQRMTLRCGRVNYALPVLPVEDYPALPDNPPASGSLPGPLFAQALSQVSVAATRDDTVPFLMGVKIEIDGTKVTLAATDRYRLAVRTLEWTPSSPNLVANALVQAKMLADAAKSLAMADEVRLAFTSQGEGRMGIEGLNRKTTARLIAAEFPKFAQLLPKEPDTLAWVETDALIDAVKRVSLVVENKSTAVRLVFNASDVMLRAGQVDDSSVATATDILDCVTEGDPIDIAFNPQYLLDGLGHLNKKYVRLAFTQANKPAVLTGANEPGGENDDSYLYLLMPVRMTSAP